MQAIAPSLWGSVRQRTPGPDRPQCALARRRGLRQPHRVGLRFILEPDLPRAASAAPITNRLLDRLPAKDRARVLDGCESVELAFPEVLAEPGGAIRNIYFPTDSFISLLVPMGGK